MATEHGSTPMVMPRPPPPPIPPLPFHLTTAKKLTTDESDSVYSPSSQPSTSSTISSFSTPAQESPLGHTSIHPQLRIETTLASEPVEEQEGEEEAEEGLPTYESVEEKEPENPRFGRWKGWIEKRARETADERQMMRASGYRRAWDPEEDHQAMVGKGEDGEGVDADESAQDDLRRSGSDGLSVEDKVPSRQYRISNPSPPPESKSTSNSPNATSATTSGPTVQSPVDYRPSPQTPHPSNDIVHLTTSVSMHNIGSKFAKHIEEKPTGAICIQDTNRRDRWVLTSTQGGLYITDLRPPLSSAFHLNYQDPPNTLQLIHNLPISQLEIFTEDPEKRRGVIFALFARTNEIRMWSLHKMIELIEWRFKEGAESLNLSASPPSSTSSPTSSISSKHVRGSNRAYIKSFFVSPSTSSPPADLKGKGKVSSSLTMKKSRKSGSGSGSEIAERVVEDDYVVLDSRPFPLRAKTGDFTEEFDVMSLVGEGRKSLESEETRGTSAESDSHLIPASIVPPPPAKDLTPIPTPKRSSTPVSIPTSESSSPPPPPPPPKSPLDLPLAWARSSIPLPVPKPHSHHSQTSNLNIIQFFTLSRVPHDSNFENEEEEKEYEEDESARRRKREEENGWLMLAVATKGMVHVFESRPTENRVWAASHELYAPAPPTFITFIRATKAHAQNSPLTTRRPTTSVSSPTSTSQPHPSSPLHHLTLVLGTRSKAVLVHLSDSSVSEIAFASSSSIRSPSLSSLKQSLTTRVRSGSSSSSKFSSSPTTMGKRAAVRAFVESKMATPPAGIKGSEISGMIMGRKVSEDGQQVQEEGEVDEVDNWVGCEEVILGSKAFYFLTKGRETFVVASPLEESETTSEVSAPGPAPPPISPTTLHVFQWPQHLSQLHIILPDSPSTQLDTYPIALVGATRTGVAVQEGLITNSVGKEGKEKMFTPSKASESLELGDKSSFDFGRQTGLLCRSGEWRLERGDSQAMRGTFCWTEAPAEFRLKWIG